MLAAQSPSPIYCGLLPTIRPLHTSPDNKELAPRLARHPPGPPGPPDGPDGSRSSCDLRCRPHIRKIGEHYVGKHNDELPRSRAAISTGKGRRLGVLVLLPHHLRLDGPDGEKAPASNRVVQFFALFGCGRCWHSNIPSTPILYVHVLIRQGRDHAAVYSHLRPGPGCSAWALAGQSDCTVTKPASPGHGVTPEGRWEEGAVGQLTNYKTLGLSRHIGTSSGPSVGVILRSEKLPTIGCSGLERSRVRRV